MFWKKKNEGANQRKETLNSDEYDKCIRRIAEIDSRVKLFEVDLEVLKTGQSNLRGILNRKLKGLEEGEKKEEEVKKNIYTSEFIPFG